MYFVRIRAIPSEVNPHITSSRKHVMILTKSRLPVIEFVLVQTAFIRLEFCPANVSIFTLWNLSKETRKCGCRTERIKTNIFYIISSRYYLTIEQLLFFRISKIERISISEYVRILSEILSFYEFSMWNFREWKIGSQWTWKWSSKKSRIKKGKIEQNPFALNDIIIRQ